MLTLVFRDAKTAIPQRFAVPAGKARIGRAAGNEIRVRDEGISRVHADVTRSGNSVRLDDLQSKNGILERGVRVPFAILKLDGPSVQIGTKFVTVEEADTGDHIAEFPVERAERPEQAKLTLPLDVLREATTGKGLQRVVRKSKAMQRVVLRALAFARTSRPVLLLGETGTGKEVIARLIAENADRRGPYLKVNCATMTPELISSELFGIEDGVATGVRARRGHFVEAEGGTLFLDEIGEIDARMQGRLLRAIEENEIWPVGARSPRRVTARVILATNDPAKLRTDLYHRCKRIGIPPLRERPEDIAALARHFIEKACKANGVETIPISRRAVELLAAQPWPGNARDLHGVLEDAVLLYGDAPMLHAEHIESVLETCASPAQSLRERQDALTRTAVLQALEEHRGNKSAAARSMGMSRNGLEKTIQRLGLDSRLFTHR